MLLRALTLRCPHCGGGGLYRRWVVIRPTCPRCGLRFDRGEEGYGVGTYMFNLIFSEFVLVVLLVLLVFGLDLGWSDTIETLAIAGMATAPLVIYPFAKLLFLTFDLCFRPLRDGDFPAASASRAPRDATV